MLDNFTIAKNNINTDYPTKQLNHYIEFIRN